jgi:hypothetical protein
MPLKSRTFHHLGSRFLDLVVLVREMVWEMGTTSSGSGRRRREVDERKDGIRFCCHGFCCDEERTDDVRRLSLGD